VRFAGGTTPAQMHAAVVKAGGEVVTDLSPVGAMAVAPQAGDFAMRIAGGSRVTSVFDEPLFESPVGRDGAVGGQPVGQALFGKSRSFPDPWHDASSFLGMTNPQGILQWDDARMNVPTAWAKTLGDRSVRVAVLDTGFQSSHKELKDNVAGKGQTFVPCDAFKREFGEKALKQAGLTDCGLDDQEGHGTWVASRIGGALNGFASNGVAPHVQLSSYKVLAAGFGALPDWILSGLLAACSDGVDLVNMSITGYLDPSDPTDAQTYLLFNDVVRYCRARGVTIFAAAGNEHVRVDRVTTSVGGLTLSGVGRVSNGPDGIATTPPGADSADFDLRGQLEAPAGVPGVVMVSATNNGNGAAPAADPFGFGMHVRCPRPACVLLELRLSRRSRRSRRRPPFQPARVGRRRRQHPLRRLGLARRRWRTTASSAVIRFSLRCSTLRASRPTAPGSAGCKGRRWPHRTRSGLPRSWSQRIRHYGTIRPI